jgi:multisubunit Na+/H+ antiporter MnhG subunit
MLSMILLRVRNDAMTVDTILGIIGTVLGVIGLLTGYIFYKWSLRVKEPRVSQKTNNLIRDYIAKFDGLEILYKGAKIQNLTVTKILFWNEGSETIDKQDLTNADPLRITVDDGYIILDYRIISCNNEASKFNCVLSEDKSSLLIEFDYIDRNQGLVVQVVHTGINQSDIWVTGVIKGAVLKYKKIQPEEATPQFISRFVRPIYRRAVLAFLSITFGVPLLMLGIVLVYLMIAELIKNGWSLPPANSRPVEVRPDPISPYFFMLFPVMITFFGYALIMAGVDVWRNRSPKGLDAFEE